MAGGTGSGVGASSAPGGACRTNSVRGAGLEQAHSGIRHRAISPVSKSFFMSRSRTILGIVFPGEIEPPQEGDITLTWVSKYSVEIYLAARPYNCPKKITCNILLDLTNYATA